MLPCISGSLDVKKAHKQLVSILPFNDSSSAFPTGSLGFTIFGEIFAYVTIVFNPTIEVVSFQLHGWCMLGVFLLLAFTRLGHECQDLESMRWNACVHRLELGLFFHPKVSGKWNQNPC